MELNYRELFVIVKIAVLLTTLGLQYYLYKILRRPLQTTFTGATALGNLVLSPKHILLAVMIILNLPGIYIAFGGAWPVPNWLAQVSVYPYAVWQISSLVLVAFYFPAQWSYRYVKARRNPAQDTLIQENEMKKKDNDSIDKGRRTLLRTSIMAAPAYVLGASSIAAMQPDDYEIVRKTITIPDLPEKLKGLKIALISDIHSGPYMDKYDMDGYVNVVNSLKPDVILIPGDFVNNDNEQVVPLCDAFQRLQAEYGVYGSLGNHDYFDSADYVANEIQNCGVNLLRNGHSIIEPRGEKFAIIGMEDVHPNDTFDQHFKPAVKGLSPELPHVLMCHKPYYLEHAAGWGVKFMVSGHTHGGQIVLARLFDAVLSPATLVSSYIEGLYTADATQMYITRGIGMVGIPVRINCPPEVTLFTLA